MRKIVEQFAKCIAVAKKMDAWLTNPSSDRGFCQKMEDALRSYIEEIGLDEALKNADLTPQIIGYIYGLFPVVSDDHLTVQDAIDLLPYVLIEYMKRTEPYQNAMHPKRIIVAALVFQNHVK